MFEAIFDKHVLTHAGDTAGPLAERNPFPDHVRFWLHGHTIWDRLRIHNFGIGCETETQFVVCLVFSSIQGLASMESVMFLNQ